MSLIMSEQAYSKEKTLVDFHIITLIVHNQPQTHVPSFPLRLLAVPENIQENVNREEEMTKVYI